MKEIVVISGKGGTGKTSITASLAVLAGTDAIIADCDVDAADMHLLLQPVSSNEQQFFSGVIAEIDPAVCTLCGKCAEICRFNAIKLKDVEFSVDEINCEGCGYCARICPAQAITMNPQKTGNWYISDIRTTTQMVHAKLGIGAENSGKLVAQVKKAAREIAVNTQKSFIIVDGPPGIGCPVISSISGADFIVLVTEASISGLNDLKRVYQLVKKFKIKAGCIINKADINPEITNEILDFLRFENIFHITNIPYHSAFTKAMLNGLTIIEFDNNELKSLLITSWEQIKTNAVKG